MADVSGRQIFSIAGKRSIRHILCIGGTDRVTGLEPNCHHVNNTGDTGPDHSGTLVSVIMPSYNHAKYITQAILSVVNQTHKNIELLIIDDGSNDGSPSTIEGVLSGIGRFNAELVVQENHGAHEAINRGISMARGDYISILNSDDYYYPDRVSRLLDKTLLDGYQFVFSKVDHVSPDGDLLGKENHLKSEYLSMYESIGEFPSIGFALLNYNLTVSTGNFFMRKSLIDKVGLFNNYKVVHDWDYVLRVLLQTEPCLVNEPLLGYRVHQGSILARMLPLSAKECVSVIGNYFETMLETKSPNPLAPAPYNWPEYFDLFMREYPKKNSLKLWDIIRLFHESRRVSHRMRASVRQGDGTKWRRLDR